MFFGIFCSVEVRPGEIDKINLNFSKRLDL